MTKLSRLVILALTLVASTPFQSEAQDLVTIAAARRARSYARGLRELRPSRPGEVVLVITLRGVPYDQWRNSQIYLIAGREKTDIVRRVTFSGSDDRVAVFLVPDSTSRFELHVGSFAAIEVVPEEAIVDNIIVR